MLIFFFFILYCRYCYYYCHVYYYGYQNTVSFNQCPYLCHLTGSLQQLYQTVKLMVRTRLLVIAEKYNVSLKLLFEGIGFVSLQWL